MGQVPSNSVISSTTATSNYVGSAMRIHDFRRKKLKQSKISMLTCYDYPSARIVDESTIDCVLVGDSVAMAVHGHETTIMATMDMMILHTQAVARGIKKKFIISDMPFLEHRRSQAQTIKNAKALLQAGAHAIKIEGADDHSCQTIRFLVDAGVPIMGHIGLMPQSVHQLGGYKVQGKEPEQAALIMQQATNLETAGCFAIVLECIPQELAKKITATLIIPTIGIGAGMNTDGQVLVWHDLLGLQTDFKPRFLKQYAQGKALILDAINNYAEQVQQGAFPSDDHSF